MNHTDHERARRLMAASAVEGISSAERVWLDGHIASCDACFSEAAALTSAIQSLRSVPVAAGSDLVLKTKRAVRARAEELEAAREHSAPLWIAVAMCIVWTIVTTPYIWRTFARLGETVHIPAAAWALGFVMLWFVPATVVAAVAAWRHVDNDDVSWAAAADWRRQ